MKIVCDACQAKYFVSDDNVQKKVVRLTCQKCGHTIHARNQTAASKASSSAGVAQLRARLGLGSASAPGLSKRPPKSPPVIERKTWYYSKDGQSFGPFAESALLERFGSGELGEECYVWHKKLGDWLPAFSTAPFSEAIEAVQEASGEVVLEPFDDDLEELAGDATQIAPRPTSDRLQGLRDRLGGGDEDGDEAEDEGASLSSDFGEVDLDFDGVSRSLTVDEIQEEEASLADDSDIIDLDVDEASKVVSLADIMEAANAGGGGKAAKSEDWLTQESADAREDLFAAMDAAREAGELDDEIEEAPAEASMLIHLSHLQARTKKTRRVAVIAVVALVGVVALFIVLITLHETDEIDVQAADGGDTGVIAEYGTELSDADLERLAPESEFSLTVYDDDGGEETIVDGGEVVADAGAVEELVDSTEGADAGDLEAASGGAEEGGAAEDAAPEPEDGGDDMPDLNPLVGGGDGGASKSKSGGDDEEVPDLGLSGLGGDLSADVGDQKVERRKRSKVSLTGGGSSDGPSVKSGGSDASVSATAYGSGTSRRKRLSVSRTEIGTKKQSKNNAAAKLRGAARSPYVPGLKKVSRSVQECTRRAGDSVSAKKIYITLKIGAKGDVDRVRYDKKIRGSEFEGCLESKSKLWSFPASEDGKSVELRQGFVIE